MVKIVNKAYTKNWVCCGLCVSIESTLRLVCIFSDLLDILVT